MWVGWVVASLFSEAIADLYWVALPVICGLAWRFEGIGYVPIAVLTVPLAVALLIADGLAGRIGWIVIGIGVTLLALMLFSVSFTRWWLRLVSR